MSKYDELLKEAHENIKQDRVKLKDLLQKLADNVEHNPALLPTLIAATSEVVDGLTRANAQLVELVKVEARRAGEQKGSFSDEDTDGLYDAINSGSNEEN